MNRTAKGMRLMQELEDALVETYCKESGWEPGSEDAENAVMVMGWLMPVIDEHVAVLVGEDE